MAPPSDLRPVPLWEGKGNPFRRVVQTADRDDDVLAALVQVGHRAPGGTRRQVGLPAYAPGGLIIRAERRPASDNGPWGRVRFGVGGNLQNYDVAPPSDLRPVPLWEGKGNPFRRVVQTADRDDDVLAALV